jgi:hypothetical protein
MELVSSASSREITARELLLIAGAALLGMLFNLALSAATYRLGYPLDDSWIHATFARNLALQAEWAFRPGQLSAGSTAPLWTLLLAPGYWLGIAPLWWSYALGYLGLVGLGALAEATVRRLDLDYGPRLPWVGFFLVFEWHILWAAASGMETVLHALLTTAVLAMIITGSRRYAAMGVLTGLGVWARPDSLLLLIPALLALCLAQEHVGRRGRALLSFFTGFIALLIPYLILNLWLSDRPLPSTYYAKQTEYAVWQARPVLDRAAQYLLQASTGPLLVLWPGLLLWAVRIARSRGVAAAAALLWCVLYMVAYMLRLPPYQHGRYIMPVMPALALMGLLGYLEFVRSRWFGKRHWAVKKVWQFSIILLSAAFLVLGARAYAQDVGLIESEMVNSATWVAANVPADAVIAAHDIGALGYFDDHELIDMAGLISPEVLPFMRDESRLAAHLDRRGAQYLVAFPDLYPELAAASAPVYSTGGIFAPSMGEKNMTVYCWRCK